MNAILQLFKTESRPHRGLLAAEWAVVAYMALTSVLLAVLYHDLDSPVMMILGRAKVVFLIFAMWAVYRLVPCRLTRFGRIAVQMAMLGWWYPDTYEFNQLFGNYDHIFAGWDQQLFGFQPSLLFFQALPGRVFSELMDFGYASYFPMILIVTLYYFLFRYKDFGYASFVIMASFFLYYVIYVALPVTGPQYYYNAIGLDNVAGGVFPEVGDWFATHSEALKSPGWTDGVFYNMVVQAHEAGERPTAAFPSSHVGVSTILLLLLWKARQKVLLAVLAPVYVLLCLSTVYIYAHYAVDVFAGWISAVLFFFPLTLAYDRLIRKREPFR